MTIAELNSFDCTRFVEAVGWVFEHSPWVAERAWMARPFADLEALHAAMKAEVERAQPEEQLDLLRAHPDLGTRARLNLTSAGEQAGAGLDRLTPEEFERLQRLNSASASGNARSSKYARPRSRRPSHVSRTPLASVRILMARVCRLEGDLSLNDFSAGLGFGWKCAVESPPSVPAVSGVYVLSPQGELAFGTNGPAVAFPPAWIMRKYEPAVTPAAEH